MHMRYKSHLAIVFAICELPGKTEVCNLESAGPTDEDVASGEVAVDAAVRV